MISPEAGRPSRNNHPAQVGAMCQKCATTPTMHLPQHHIPVQEGHQVGLHEVHGKPLFALVKGEGFQGLRAVVELRENHTIVASHQWT